VAELAIRFVSARTAECIVAGIPAAARAVHAAMARARMEGLPPPDGIDLVVPGGWRPSAACRAELARLVPGVPVTVSEAERGTPSFALCGERAQRAQDIESDERDLSGPGQREDAEDRLLSELRATSAAIIKATGKPTDGIVSRWLNRPVSQSITRLVLRAPGVSPMIATAAAGLIGLVMALALVLGGDEGLIWGAVLFQAASVVDGVDGEIARATFRTSDLGAMLDSVTDALTNLAFLAGISINLHQSGQPLPAYAGLAGLVIYAFGFALLGQRSVSRRAPFTFDAAKHFTMGGGSKVLRCATFVMMRDFYALAGAVMILAGFAWLLVPIFAVAVLLWFLFVAGFLIMSRGT
jgi:CDP-L-myo-inositol myo-inositolphosphotransferase